MRFIIVFLVLIVGDFRAAAEPARIEAAIIGDSTSTGGGTHPNLRYDVDVLWNVFNGRVQVAPDTAHLNDRFRALFPTNQMAAPQRLWPTTREFFGGPDWVYRYLLSTLSQVYLDTEEYSWGYLAAKVLGIDGEHLAIAAEDGARVSTMQRQIDRVLEQNEGRLPPKVFVFYTGNDLCGMDPSMITTAADFKTNMMRGLTYMARNSGVDAGQGKPIDVYLVSYMNLIQLLDSREILAKKILAFGKETTCAELRKAGYRSEDPAYQPGLPPEAWYFGMAMPPNPAAFCPTVFQPQKFGENTISDLANRIRDYRKAEAEVIEDFSKISDKAPYKNIKLRYVSTTANLLFSPDEVGEDCFHLSLKGQQKVAQTVADELKAAGH